MRLSPAIARIAGWPIETVRDLRSARLAEGVDELLRQEREIRARASRLGEKLYTAVPRIADKRVRASVLRLRRALHNSIDPLPNDDLERTVTARALTPDIVGDLRAETVARNALMQHRRTVEAAYDAALQRETAALSVIANSTDFLKALYLSSPSLFDSWTRAAQTNTRSKLLCRILRYVMRAVGRCTPNGVWSGVALENTSRTASEKTTIATSERKIRFSPCLELLIPILRAAQGGTTQPALPGIYASAWEALESATLGLLQKEAAIWLDLTCQLRSKAAELEASFETLNLEELRNVLDAARESVNCVADRYGATRVRSDVHVLLADSSAPFAFQLGEGIRALIAKRVTEYWQFDRYGLGEAHAAAQRKCAFGMVDRVAGMQFSDWLGSEGDADLTSERLAEEIALRRWRNEIEPVYRNRTHRLQIPATERSPMPHGSALLRLEVSGAGVGLRMGPLTPDPCLFYSRFQNLFGDDDVFARWYRIECQEIEHCGSGIALADLAAYSPVNPNAAVRMPLHDATVDLSSESSLTENSRIELGPGGRARWFAADRRAIVPLLHSAAALDGADPSAARVHLISHLLGRPSLMSPLPALWSEQQKWRHLPGLYLGQDTVVSPERWTIPAETAGGVAASTGLERFVTWRRLVTSLSLPAAVYQKHYSAETELLMYTDSVLAVENLGWMITTYPSEFRLQEVLPAVETSWVVDDAGRHYLAEIAVAWGGEEEFWTEYSGACSSEAPALACMGIAREN